MDLASPVQNLDEASDFSLRTRLWVSLFSFYVRHTGHFSHYRATSPEKKILNSESGGNSQFKPVVLCLLKLISCINLTQVWVNIFPQ